MCKRNYKYSFTLIGMCLLFVFLVVTASTGQNRGKLSKQQRKEVSRLTKYARNAEDNARYEKALEIWHAIYELKPGDYTSYHGIKRNLTNLERFDDALEFIDASTAMANSGKTSLDPAMLTSDRVDVLFSAGEENEALLEAETALVNYKGSAVVYSEISRIFATHRQTDRVINTLLRGREECKNPFLYARDLAAWHEARMNWGKAAEEYLLYLRDSFKRYTYVIGALGDMPAHLGADSIAREVVSVTADTATGEFKLKLHKLLASLYFRAKIYEKALEQYKLLDTASGDPGVELLEFAQRLNTEGEYQLAREAFNELLEGGLTGQLRAKTLLGMVYASFEMGEYDSAKVVCHAVLTPGSDANSIIESYSWLGRIALDIENNPDQARTYFDSAVKLSNKSKVSPETVNQLRVQSAISLARANRLKEALAELTNLVKGQKRRSAAFSQARYEMARLAFMLSDFELTGQRINELMLADPGSHYSNEALNLKAMIADLKNDPESLILISKADLELFLHREESALNILDSLQDAGNPRVREAVFWRVYEIRIILRDFHEALTAVEGIIRIGDAAVRADHALVAAGDLCMQNLESEERAIMYYETLLIEFPDSPLVDQTRKKLLNYEGIDS